MAIRLGLDASQSVSSCAVSAGREILALSTAEKPIENFSTLIRDTLARAGVELGDVDEIVACAGPGSQIGVRTAVVTGNALALALGVPVAGALSTDALAAANARGPQKVAVPDGRGGWFVAAYGWDGDTLRRPEPLRLVKELPADGCPVLRADDPGFAETALCARGLLLIAEGQRHLLTQPPGGEIAPYEYAEP